MTEDSESLPAISHVSVLSAMVLIDLLCSSFEDLPPPCALVSYTTCILHCQHELVCNKQAQVQARLT